MSHFDELLLLQKLDEISSQARTNPQNTKPQKTMSRTDEELLNDYIKSFGEGPRPTRLEAPDVDDETDYLRHYEQQRDNDNSRLNKFLNTRKVFDDSISDLRNRTPDELWDLLHTLGQKNSAVNNKINYNYTLEEFDFMIKHHPERVFDIINDHIRDYKNYLDTTVNAIRADLATDNNQIELAKSALNDKIKPYESMQSALNTPIFDTKRFPGETEQDYITRMNQNLETFDSREVLNIVKPQVIKKFKTNLKEIIKDPSTIESINNSIERAFGQDDGDVVVRAIINKKWAFIKKEFITQFGEFPSSITVQDFIDFIDIAYLENESTHAGANRRNEFTKLVKKLSHSKLTDEQKDIVDYLLEQRFAPFISDDNYNMAKALEYELDYPDKSSKPPRGSAPRRSTRPRDEEFEDVHGPTPPPSPRGPGGPGPRGPGPRGPPPRPPSVPGGPRRGPARGPGRPPGSGPGGPGRRSPRPAPEEEKFDDEGAPLEPELSSYQPPNNDDPSSLLRQTNSSSSVSNMDRFERDNLISRNYDDSALRPRGTIKKTKKKSKNKSKKSYSDESASERDVIQVFSDSEEEAEHRQPSRYTRRFIPSDFHSAAYVPPRNSSANPHNSPSSFGQGPIPLYHNLANIAGRQTPHYSNSEHEVTDDELQQLDSDLETSHIVLDDIAKKFGTHERGKGIHFGRYHLKPDYLFEKNKLKVKQGSGADKLIRELPITTVTDQFVRFLRKVINEKKIDRDSYNSLNSLEQKLFDKLVNKSGMKHHLNHNIKINEEELLQKLKIIEGEIEAGNNNKKLLHQATKIVNELIKYDRLDSGDGKAYITKIRNALKTK